MKINFTLKLIEDKNILILLLETFVRNKNNTVHGKIASRLNSETKIKIVIHLVRLLIRLHVFNNFTL